MRPSYYRETTKAQMEIDGSVEMATCNDPLVNDDDAEYVEPLIRTLRVQSTQL